MRRAGTRAAARTSSPTTGARRPGPRRSTPASWTWRSPELPGERTLGLGAPVRPSDIQRQHSTHRSETMAVKKIPDGHNRLSPYLIVNGAARAIDFYTKAFGAVETFRHKAPDGKIGHAELR